MPSQFTTLDPDAPFTLADGTEMVRIDGEWVEVDDDEDDDPEGCGTVVAGFLAIAALLGTMLIGRLG